MPDFTKAVLFVASLLLAMAANPAEAQDNKPNIILILADDLGYKALTCNGGNLYTTPNLDTLAKKGMRFTQCNASPMCSPSRTALLTGKYNFRNYTRWGYLDTTQRTFGNMFTNAGYKTGCFGKWQMDGGDKSITKFGFSNYCVWNAFLDSIDSRYKNPRIYANGEYIADSVAKGKYGPDIFLDSAIKFIDNNKTQPFFLYLPMVLTHAPFQPTPADSTYSTWKFQSVSDTSYFVSMLQYMDMQIGKLVTKVKDAGIENNTVIIFVADNGTPTEVVEYLKGKVEVMGGKSSTKERGTHVPMIAYWPNNITPGSVNNDLIDFTDFLPSLADIANIPLPDYGPLDGVSFEPRLKGEAGTPREWIFNYYVPYSPNNDAEPRRWVQTVNYKLYDTSLLKPQREFYNIKNDPNEVYPINDSLLSYDEKLIKEQLINIINDYVQQGTAILGIPDVIGSTITDSCATVLNAILSNGGSTITATGIIWSKDHNAVLSDSNYINSKNYDDKGMFKSFISRLTSNTTYYVRTYATNAAGTAYSKEASFTTPPKAPLAYEATEIDSLSFVANWEKENRASSYTIDVSTIPDFFSLTPIIIKEGFNKEKIPDGWVSSEEFMPDTSDFGIAAPSIQFKRYGQKITTTKYPAPVEKLSFWIRSHITNSGSSFLVEGYNGHVWKTIENIKNISKQPAIKIYDSGFATWENDFVAFRFTYAKNDSYISFDDVNIHYSDTATAFLAAFRNTSVQATSLKITGLKANTKYYYRVRAVNSNGTSGNSNTIQAVTCARPAITKLAGTNLICNNDSSGTAGITANGIGLSYKWTGPASFTSTQKDLNKLAAGTYSVAISSYGTCTVDTSIVLTEPAALKAAVTTGEILCHDSAASLTINADGGTGNLRYSLFDGTNTIGPQEENQFKIATGNYTVITEDNNHCIFTSTFNIENPKTMSVTVDATPINCAGETSVITVNAKGGKGNYRYTLTDGLRSTGPQKDNRFTTAAGNYTVIVEDDNQCSIKKDFSIEDEIHSCIDATVYPNPCTDEFNLSINGTRSNKIKIIVTDMRGSIVFKAENNNSGKHKFGHNFLAGMYLLHIQQGNIAKTLKLIKIQP